MNARVIVFGNEKGGSGKTTISVHTAIYMASNGYRVASIDLDIRQQSFNRYMENRAAYIASHNAPLPMLNVVTYPEREMENALYIEEMMNNLIKNHDILVIDTPGSISVASNTAHSMADIIVTPINDSFIDLDLLGQIKNNDHKQIVPGIYSQNVWTQKLKRAKETGREIDWVVMRNRLANLEAKNKYNVERTLSILSKKFGFRVCSAFSERVIFRELFTRGLTLVDIMKTDNKPAVSHIAARQELRNLINDLNLLAKVPVEKT